MYNPNPTYLITNFLLLTTYIVSGRLLLVYKFRLRAAPVEGALPDLGKKNQ